MTPTAEDAAARRIVEAFGAYNAQFRRITRRSSLQFDSRDWKAMQSDAVERIELYDRYVNAAVADERTRLGARTLDRAMWQTIRQRFVERIDKVPDSEFIKTFFSSITRRLFGTVGVAPDLEFMATDLDPLAGIHSHVETRIYENRGSIDLLLEDVLSGIRFRSGWRDFEGSLAHVKAGVESELRKRNGFDTVQSIEVVKPLFFQRTRAYLVGRVIGRGYVLPLVIALKNTDQGVLVDAVLLSENDTSIVFGFARSYFHVDLDRVGEAVLFLKSLMPRKPVSELFTILGRVKQGKTERFRELMRHLEHTDDRFVHAAGERGLVMVCFTLPSFDVVFKVIRDRFPPPKTVLREEVLAKYQLVFNHDRAGRLIDAQEYRRLRFPIAYFAPALLEELLSETAGTVHQSGSDLIFDHLYIERRMTPLNLYLKTASAEAAECAVIDYGQCIRDLAYSNIFAGDLLLKNFGVTRHGRVIFYDYDELCALTDCRFRDLPTATNEDDETRAESWFYVADNDVFPETFLRFLAFDERQRELFLRSSGDLLSAQFWRGIQARLGEGRMIEVLPYQRYRVHTASSG